jgi:hypothetical protein
VPEYRAPVPIDDDLTFARSEVPLAADLDGEIVLLNPENGDFFGLRGVAGRIWDLFESPQSVRSLVATLTDEYDVDPAVCTDEVRRFVEKLTDAELIHRA